MRDDLALRGLGLHARGRGVDAAGQAGRHGRVNPAQQGYSVALSGNGNTAILGGPFDNTPSAFIDIGAAWAFARSGGVWTQQAKMVDASAVANSRNANGTGVRLRR